jgi:hypothetical protein
MPKRRWSTCLWPHQNVYMYVCHICMYACMYTCISSVHAAVVLIDRPCTPFIHACMHACMPVPTSSLRTMCCFFYRYFPVIHTKHTYIYIHTHACMHTQILLWPFQSTSSAHVLSHTHTHLRIHTYRCDVAKHEHHALLVSLNAIVITHNKRRIHHKTKRRGLLEDISFLPGVCFD